MPHPALFLCAFLAAGVLPGAEPAVLGTWEADVAGRATRLTLHPTGVSRTPGLEAWLPCEVLTGLRAPAAPRGEEVLAFELARAAGRLICHGEPRRGGGRGSFAFHPEPGFRQALMHLGAAPDAEVLLALALGDVGLDDLQALVARGYRDLTGSEIVGMTAREPEAASPRLLLPEG